MTRKNRYPTLRAWRLGARLNQAEAARVLDVSQGLLQQARAGAPVSRSAARQDHQRQGRRAARNRPGAVVMADSARALRDRTAVGDIPRWSRGQVFSFCNYRGIGKRRLDGLFQKGIGSDNGCSVVLSHLEYSVGRSVGLGGGAQDGARVRVHGVSIDRIGDRGPARRGRAWSSVARAGTARQGVVGPGVARRGEAGRSVDGPRRPQMAFSSGQSSRLSYPNLTASWPPVEASR